MRRIESEVLLHNMPSMSNVTAEQDCSRAYQPNKLLNLIMLSKIVCERLWKQQNRNVYNAALHRYNTNPSTRVNYSNLHEQIRVIKRPLYVFTCE